MTGASAAAVRVERFEGTAGAFHDRELPAFDRPEVWVFEVTTPAVVLGSTQDPAVVDARRAAAAGVEVVRRRSGGGAVWLAPDEVTWIDVLVPAGHPRWAADVGRSALWAGEALAGALMAPGVALAAPPQVHRGPMRRGPWSDLVCFGGVAAGEVTVAGAKVVGISQRRTRAGARLQCAVLHRWDPRPLLDVLALTPEDRLRAGTALREAAAGVGPPGPEALVGALVDALQLPG